RRFWRKSGAKLQPFFQPHKFFTHFFSKKISLKKKRTLRSNCGTARNGDGRGAERFLFARVAEFL
ncbi:MAG: hypothetical protein II519_07680, partial [Muribaculaceae bacterium]|nr:hypothetical protein [Muribaculaceae bacterium]